MTSRGFFMRFVLRISVARFGFMKGQIIHG